MLIKVRKRERPNGADALREHLERQLSLSVEPGMPRSEDPLYAVTESFQREFRNIGLARSERFLGEKDRQEQSEDEEKARQTEDVGKTSQETQKREGAPDTGHRIKGAPVEEFSKMAFTRGELSAAVLQGTGKMALISCLKRSAGQPQQGTTLFGLGAQTSNVPSRDPDQMMFHRNFAKSAVGLVVDTLRDARQTVDSLTEMAMGTDNFRAEDGGVTLRTMYPFLDDSREKLLLEERRERLRGDCTPEERAILENAAVHAEALIAKKARMKEEFIQKLREISDRATQALAELERPETLEEAAQALSELDIPVPPDDAPPSGDTFTDKEDTPLETPLDGDTPLETFSDGETPVDGTAFPDIETPLDEAASADSNE